LTVILIKQRTSQKLSNFSTIFIIIKQWQITPTSLHHSRCSKCTDRTMESVYATSRLSHPQCATGISAQMLLQL